MSVAIDHYIYCNIANFTTHAARYELIDEGRSVEFCYASHVAIPAWRNSNMNVWLCDNVSYMLSGACASTLIFYFIFFLQIWLVTVLRLTNCVCTICGCAGSKDAPYAGYAQTQYTSTCTCKCMQCTYILLYLIEWMATFMRTIFKCL